MFAKRSTKGRKRLTLRDEEEIDDLTAHLYKVGKKRKESAKYCTKTTGKDKFVGKNTRSNNKILNTMKHQLTCKENVEQKRQTVSKVKKTNLRNVSSTLPRTILTKLPSLKTVQGQSYHSNTSAADDLTASPLCTPPSMKQLFASGLAEIPSISSSPKSSRVNSARKQTKRGCLKHKRWVMSSLKVKNQECEDDLFENCEIKEPFLLDDSCLYDANIATPKCTYSIPQTNLSRTPPFKDCYSPTHLSEARRVAEEYMYRRDKRRNSSIANDSSSARKKTAPLKSSINVSSEAKLLELQKLGDTLNKRQSSKDDSEGDSDVSF